MSETLPPGSPGAPSGPDGPSPQGGTDVLERTKSREQASPGDAERYAHYVPKEKILASAMSGEPVIALCGKIWLPGRDPSKFPVCPVCKEIYASMQGGSDGSGGSDGPSGGSGSSDG